LKRNIIALLVVVLFVVSIIGAYAAVKGQICPMTKEQKAQCMKNCPLTKAQKAKMMKTNSCPMTKEQRAKCMKMNNCPMSKANSKSMDKCKNGVCPIPKKPAGKVSKKVVSAICPVMGNKISDIRNAAGKSVYKGKTYYFCCPMCKPKFDANPKKYIK
jgi:YHS domain-containing protein